MKWPSLSAIASVAYKEFLHIYRDRRVLLLLIILPPLFTLIFGHAFENTELTDVPALLIDRDQTPRTARFIEIISKDKTFHWRMPAPDFQGESDLIGNGVKATLVIPVGWTDSLNKGDPKPLPLYLDDSDTNTASAVEGAVQKNLGTFQSKERDLLVESLPEEVIELGKKLPIDIRKQFVSLMTAWSAESKNLYNPKSRFIDYVVPGVIGLILQLLTVTLMACTIARERESGTLYQLLVTSLQRGEIVIGKMLPYLVVSICLVVVIMALSWWHFGVAFYQLSRAGPDLPAVPPLLTRTGFIDFDLLAHPNPSDPIFRFLSVAGLCSLRGICATRTTAKSDPIHLGTFPAHPFLSGLSAGEHVPRRRLVLCCRSCCASGGRADHVYRRGLSPKTN